MEVTKTHKLIVKLEFAVDELMRSFAQRTVDCVIRAVRNSLEALGRYASCKDSYQTLKETAFTNDLVIQLGKAS